MPTETPSNKPATMQYCILAVLFLVTAAYQVRHAVFIAEYLAGQIDVVRAPGTLDDTKPVVTKVEKEAAQAGLQVGDTLLEVNGRPFRSEVEVVRAIEYAHGGETLQLGVRHKDGALSTVVIPLVEHPHTASDHWLFVITLHVLLPLCCAGLGFWVAALRPRERLAWILLALLMGFSQVIGIAREMRTAHW